MIGHRSGSDRSAIGCVSGTVSDELVKLDATNLALHEAIAKLALIESSEICDGKASLPLQHAVSNRFDRGENEAAFSIDVAISFEL